MPELTANEATIVRRTNYSLKRYVSICPRDVVFMAGNTTSNVTQDADTLGVVALQYDVVYLGVYGDVSPGMSLDIGTTPGARDIGCVRIRKAASSSQLYIAETGAAEFAIENWVPGLYFTVRNERRIWNKLPYLTKTKSGQYYDTFDFQVDYDVDYTDETDNYPPIVNITGDMAGFVDRTTVASESECDYTGASAVASSDYFGTSAQSVLDNDSGTAWQAGDLVCTSTLDVQLASSVLSGKVGLLVQSGVGATPRDFDVQYWNGASYTTAASVTDFDSWESGELLVNFSPVTASLWRINITDCNDAPPGAERTGVYISEVNIYNREVTAFDYRTVELDASGSEAVAPSATISSYAWDVVDGTITVGNSASAAITVRFPRATVFRYISCTVTDSNATTSTRYYPIWVHSDENPPLPYDVAFQITRDEATRQGREMDVVLVGGADAADASVVPDGTLACYWEDVSFDGDAPPDAYRNQFMGWIIRDDTALQLYRDAYTFTIAGPGLWLQQMIGFPLSFLRRSSPSEWYHMASPTDDRAIVTILRYLTTYLDVCGLFQSDRSDQWYQKTGSDFAAIRVDSGSVWDQLTVLTQEYSGEQGIDTNGDMWLRRHPCLMPGALTPDRDDVDVLIALTAADRDYENPLEIPTTVLKPTGSVQVDGFFWSGVENIPLRARAPGRAPGFGSQSENPAVQVLPTTSQSTAKTVLRQVAGHWWEWVNSPAKDIPYQLVGNLDVADPARLEWITVTENANVRGVSLSATRFIVTRVSVQHSTDTGQSPKRITWSISKETKGYRGNNVKIDTGDVVDDDWSDPGDWWPDDYDDTTTGVTLGSVNQIATFNTDNYLYRTENFRSAYPNWERIDLSGSISGTIQQFVVDAFSPGYLGTGTAINGWLVTSLAIYRVTDIFATTPGVASQKTFRTPGGSISNHSIDASFGTQNHVVCVSYYGTDGTYVTYTTDGSTWSAEAAITAFNNTAPGTYDDIFPGVFVSSKTAGLVYTTAFKADDEGVGYVSTNYGASWTETNGTNGPVMDTGNGLADDIHVPYANTNEIEVWYGALSASGGVSGGWVMGSLVSTHDISDGGGWERSEMGTTGVVLSYDAYMLAFRIDDFATLNLDTVKRSLPANATYDHKFTGTTSDHLEDHLAEGDAGWFFVGSTTVGDLLFGAGNYWVMETPTANWSETIGSPVATVGERVGAAVTCTEDRITSGTLKFYLIYNYNSSNPPPGGTAAYSVQKTGSDGTTISTVGPTDYGPYGYSRWRIQSYVGDSAYKLIVVWAQGDTGSRVYTTTNGNATSPTWTARTAANSDYHRGAISGDNRSILYLWGADGAIGYSDDFGATINDKMGDMTTLGTPQEHVGICGGIQ